MAVKISFWSRLLDTVAPRLCEVCGKRLTVTEEALCAVCNLHLPRTGFQLTPLDNVMARLFWGRIPVERVAALFYYEAGAGASKLIYSLKYHDHREVGRVMGRMAAAELMPSGFFEGIDVLVPVPLSRRRQWQRGYNQSAELCRGLSEITGLSVETGAVCRKSFSKSQTRLGRWEREENVEGVFLLKDGSAVRGKHVLLVDDVVTTGATATACGRVLLEAGSVRLSIFSLSFTKEG